ncbi:MAG: hypothetical protein ACHQEM_07965 [Chitinophagales bacterium]
MNKHISLSQALITAIALFIGCTKDQVPPPKVDNTPFAITVESGDNQTAIMGNSLNVPLQVSVKNKDGKALEGIEVQFTPGTNCGTVSPENTTTDSLGLAKAVWTLGNILNTTQTLTATVQLASGSPLSANFSSHALDSVWRRFIEDTSKTVYSSIDIDSVFTAGTFSSSITSFPDRTANERFGLEFPVFTASTLVGRFFHINDSISTLTQIPFKLNGLILSYDMNPVTVDQQAPDITHTFEGGTSWLLTFNSDSTILSGTIKLKAKDSYIAPSGNNEIRFRETDYTITFKRREQ